jgi:hypothetical protein
MADVLPMRPVDPQAFSGNQQAQPEENFDMSEEGMMRYLMEKIKEIRERGTGDRSALEALMRMMDKNSAMDGSMPEGSIIERPLPINNMAPMTARNPNPNMDRGMVRSPNALKPNREAGET